MLKQSKKTRKLQFEGLENRTFMAGDVAAAVANGVLQMTGDASDNSIQFTQSGKIWQVQGIDTTINGNSAVQTFSGVTAIEIDLGAGHDSISATQGKLRSGTFQIHDDEGPTIVNLSKIVARSFDIQTSVDSDTISMDKCEAESCIILTSPLTGDDEADAVTILNSDFKRALFVNTGDGDDIVTIKNIATGTCKVQTFTPGESDQDEVVMTKFRAKYMFLVETGDGPDTITLSDVHSKALDIVVLASESAADSSIDRVIIEKSTADGGLKITTGDGADGILLEKCTVGYRIDVLTAGTSADGDDGITLREVKTGENVKIEMGDGNDRAELTKVVATKAIAVHMGGGDSDNLEIALSRALGAVLLGGDGNSDTVTFIQNKWKKNELVGGSGFESRRFY